MLLLVLLSLFRSQHNHLDKIDFNETSPKEEVKDVKAEQFCENHHKHQKEQQQIEDIHYPS